MYLAVNKELKGDNMTKKATLRTGIVLTVFANEIPSGHKHIPFDKINLQNLGINIHEIEKAEIVRLVSDELYRTRILKDRYGYQDTEYTSYK